MEEETKKTEQELNQEQPIDIDTAARLTAASTHIMDNKSVRNKRLAYDALKITAQYNEGSFDNEKFHELINKYLDELDRYIKEHTDKDKTSNVVLCEPVPQWVKDMFMDRYGLKLVENVE